MAHQKKVMLTSGNSETGTVGNGARHMGYMTRAEKKHQAELAFQEGVKEEARYFRTIIDGALDSGHNLHDACAKVREYVVVQGKHYKNRKPLLLEALKELKRTTGISITL